MKRVIITFILLLVVAALGVGGYFAVKYARNQVLVPISFQEMEKLQEQGEAAAPEIPRLVACFDRDNEDLRLQASITLGKIGAKAVDPLREQLKDPRDKVRFCAVESLAWIGPPAAPASADLLECLKDTNADVRRKAAYALGRINVKTDAVIVGLLGALSDADADVVAATQETIKHFGAPPKEAIPTLAKLAKDTNHETRVLAMALLAQIGEPAVPVFKEMLREPDRAMLSDLMRAIVPLGATAKDLLPEIQDNMIKSLWWDAEKEMLAIYKKCGADGAKSLTAVLGSLHQPKSPHFNLADDRSLVLIKTIGEMGSTGKVAVPMLIEMLNDRPALRPQILEALGDIGPAAREARTAVEALAKEPEYAERASAALKRMGVVSEE